MVDIFGSRGYTFGVRPVVCLKAEVKTNGKIERNQSATGTEQNVFVWELTI